MLRSRRSRACSAHRLTRRNARENAKIRGPAGGCGPSCSKPVSVRSPWRQSPTAWYVTALWPRWRASGWQSSRAWLTSRRTETSPARYSVSSAQSRPRSSANGRGLAGAGRPGTAAPRRTAAPLPKHSALNGCGQPPVRRRPRGRSHPLAGDSDRFVTARLAEPGRAGRRVVISEICRGCPQVESNGTASSAVISGTVKEHHAASSLDRRIMSDFLF
jgi:hypothetical protein